MGSLAGNAVRNSARNLVRNSVGNSCGKILWERLAEQGGGEKANLRKAVIGGNLAFAIG